MPLRMKSFPYEHERPFLGEMIFNHYRVPLFYVVTRISSHNMYTTNMEAESENEERYKTTNFGCDSENSTLGCTQARSQEF